MNITVIGGGAWGTTLANMFAKSGLNTKLWVREREVMAEITSKRVNTWYLPDVMLDESLEIVNEPELAVKDCENFLFAVPSQFFRSVLMSFREHLPRKAVCICANKGIELETLMTMSEVTEDVLSSLKPRFAMLSGPSFAFEVAREQPSAVTLGCEDKKTARELQEGLTNNYFRIYTNQDVRGVELGGAIKNVIAIAAGISDGLGFGTNARAALITRGLAEMSRMGKAMGAKTETFHGLSGMGDLVLTCTGELSRNRQVGLRLGKGQKLMDILREMKAVAEGVKTTEALRGLGEKHGVDMPITEEVYQVLHNDKDATRAVYELMTRELKAE
jgi:glycerol-3-phosphate dehydrogenase (NAD(P)+)